MSMDILQINEGYGKTSPEMTDPVGSVMFNISRHLVKMGHNVTILERKIVDSDSVTDYVNGIRIVRLDSQRFDRRKMRIFPHLIVDGIVFALKANKYIKKNDDFDVIHSHLPWASNVLVVINREIGKKMIYTCHLDEYRLNLSSRLRAPLYLRLFSPDLFLMKRVRKVVALNDSLRYKLISRGMVDPEKLEVIYNGVDTAMYTPNIDASYIKNKYRLNNKITVLFVGRISRRKGVEFLIKAANRVINDLGHKRVLFCLVGWTGRGLFSLGEYDSYTSYILRLIKKFKLTENVILTGYVPPDELRKLYVASDIFVLPSLEEGFGLVITQAMASGKPLIGTKVGGIPTQIKDGWNGFLVDPANEKQLAEKIEYLIENAEERINMGIRSREIAEQNFDWRKIAKRYLEVYASIN